MSETLTDEEIYLIQKIGLRISNKKIKVIIRNTEDSYTNEFVIVSPSRFDAFTTMSIVVHQGAHHRFHTVVNQELYRQISEEHVDIAQVVLDAFEDFRCNMLNGEIYPGFVKKFRQYLSETKPYRNGTNTLRNTVMQIHQRLEFENLFDLSNTYPIWDVVDAQKAFLQEYLSISAMIIAVKHVMDKLIYYYSQDRNQISEKSQFTQKTQTPHFYTNNLDEAISKAFRGKFFPLLFSESDNLFNLEDLLQLERERVIQQIDDMKKLPDSEKLNIEKTKLKLDSLIPKHEGGAETYESIIRRNSALIAKLKKEFQQIMRSTNPGRGGRHGKIMSRDLPRFVTSKGNFDRVFQIDCNSFGANLMILVDESGSMTSKKLPIAREAIISLMESLEGTKINTCVIGFAAKNSSLVVSEKVYKEFNESINKKRLASINTTPGYEYNRDGDSFELAAKHLAETNHINSIMIVISDGCPNHGCDYTSYEGRRRTNLSVRLLRNHGIELHALGIKIYTPTTYSAMYDDRDIAFIEDFEIEATLLKIIRQIALNIPKNFAV
jgi:hypothetical protein